MLWIRNFPVGILYREIFIFLTHIDLDRLLSVSATRHFVLVKAYFSCLDLQNHGSSFLATPRFFLSAARSYDSTKMSISVGLPYFDPWTTATHYLFLHGPESIFEAINIIIWLLEACIKLGTNSLGSGPLVWLRYISNVMRIRFGIATHSTGHFKRRIFLESIRL